MLSSFGFPSKRELRKFFEALVKISRLADVHTYRFVDSDF